MQSILAADYFENLGVNYYHTDRQKKSKLAGLLKLPNTTQQPKREALREKTREILQGCKVNFAAASLGDNLRLLSSKAPMFEFPEYSNFHSYSLPSHPFS
jgi:hypothetical protein